KGAQQQCRESELRRIFAQTWARLARYNLWWHSVHKERRKALADSGWRGRCFKDIGPNDGGADFPSRIFHDFPCFRGFVRQYCRALRGALSSAARNCSRELILYSGCGSRTNAVRKDPLWGKWP